jgi:hypothetical protein
MTATQEDPTMTHPDRGGEGRTLVLVGSAAIFIATVLRLGWPQQEFLAGVSLALQVAGTVVLAVHIVGYLRGRMRRLSRARSVDGS